MLNGFKLPDFKPFNGRVVAPIFKNINIPPIIAMIIMGCITRNFFGDVMKPYNNAWAQWIRVSCLGILLTRGGMNVSFTGKGILVVLMTFIPLMFEATTIALIAMGIFGMPIGIAFSLGFAVSALAVAIVAPLLMKWDQCGYGRSKGFAGSLTASSTFDNITCLILNGICKTVSMQ